MLLNVNDPFLRLIRFDKPIGTLLLYWPTLWAMFIAGKGTISAKHFVVFSLGVFFMRSAGCIVNDLADRNFDAHVQRTSCRPLATSELSVTQALFFLVVLLVVSSLLLLFLNLYCLKLAVVSLLLTLFYPFCKRFFFLPQLVLSLTFSFGVLMAFAAVSDSLGPTAFSLYFITACWIFMFDTIYALVDKDDDLKLGLNSSAITLKEQVTKVTYSLMIFIQGLWLWFALSQHFTFNFYLGWGLNNILFLHQAKLVASGDRTNFFNAFLNNNWYGLIALISIILGLPQH